MIIALIAICAMACVWLWKAPQHSVSAMLAGTAVLASLLTMVFVAIGVSK